MIKLASLLLTCDLVNPYHERKEQLEKKEKKHKKGLWEREAKEQGQAGSGEKQNNPHGTQAKREREERKIKLFNLVVLGESKSNNNTGNLSLSPLDSFLCAKIKKTTMKKKRKKDAAVKFLSLLFFWSGVFSPSCSLTSWAISPVIHQCSISNTVLLPFPRHTLSWHPLEQFKYNIKHMAEFMECKWDEKSNLLGVS